MTEHERLQKAIKDLHGCESTFLRSEPIQETFRGETVWDGVVEIFVLTDHPRASLAYAWAHETDTGGRHYVAVLGLPPVKNARDAVRASIVAQSP
jgi:hypothetical protein